MQPRQLTKEEAREAQELARRAQIAKDMWLGAYLKQRKQQIFDAWQACLPDNQELTHLKWAQMAISDIERALESDIETGTKLVPTIED